MSRKIRASRIVKPEPIARSTLPSWHNGADIEIHLYAQSLQKAAKILVEKLDLDRNARADWDGCPVVLLYREFLEIHLKSLIGEGSNFLKTRTDPISLSGSHSLLWLAQIVCRIIKRVGWESDFTCEGVTGLAEFSALVGEVESLNPIARAIRSSRVKPNPVSQFYREFDLVQFAKRLDALFALLDVTADALAAAWDELTEGMSEERRPAGEHIKPTIH